jgi:hypothetical protein
LGWTDNASNETGYQVLRDGSLIATLPADASSYTDDQVAAASSPVYTVRAVNAVGNSGTASIAVTTAAAALAAPTALSAVFDAGSIRLNWVDQSIGESAYLVKRAEARIDPSTARLSWSAAVTLPTPSPVLAANLQSYVDGPGSVVAGKVYQYQVQAVSGSRVGPVASLIAASSAGLPAPVVEGLGAVSRSSAGLQWSPTGPLTTGYEVQMCVGTLPYCALSIAVWNPMATITGGDKAKFSSSNLRTKTNYSWRVRSLNSLLPALNSPWSPPLLLSTQ